MDVKKALQFIVKTAPPIYLDDYKKICDRLSDHLELWVKDKERIAELEAEQGNAPQTVYQRNKELLEENANLKQRIAELERQADCPYTHMIDDICTKCGWQGREALGKEIDK